MTRLLKGLPFLRVAGEPNDGATARQRQHWIASGNDRRHNDNRTSTTELPERLQTQKPRPMRSQQHTDSILADMNVRINPVSVETLFEKYEEAGFLYEEKKKRLMPFVDLVKENLHKAQAAGDRIHYHLVFEDPTSKRWAAVSIWRTTTNSWTSQHLVSIGGPTGSRSVMLAAQQHRMQCSSDVGGQNWFSPTNRFPMKMFGSIQKRLGEALTSVAGHAYVNTPRNSRTCAQRQVSVTRCGARQHHELIEFVKTHRGQVYTEVEELDGDDLNLEELDTLYQTVGLRRYRRCYLAGLSGRSAPVAAAIAYRGPTGFNFSFLENRCDLILSPDLDDTQSSLVTAALIAAVSPLYEDFPLGTIPVIADGNGIGPLVELGGEFIRPYVQSIWKSSAYEEWCRHIDRFYQPILRRIECNTAHTTRWYSTDSSGDQA